MSADRSKHKGTLASGLPPCATMQSLTVATTFNKAELSNEEEEEEAEAEVDDDDDKSFDNGA